ncbi:neutral/alkaline non-lysosomal ceramidase N-terminal domain-containing protein [Candidatus Poribacteria bacterium]
MGQLKAGAARVNITPYVGINQSGFGSRKKGSVGIHDDLYAKAVVLDDGSTKIGIVGCDLLNLDESSVASIRKRVQELTGMDGANVFISTSHTHSGPLTSPLRGFGELDREWVSVLEKQIAGAIIIANSKLQDAQMGAGKGHAEINVNRRERRDNRTVLGLNPGGAIDYEVGVIRIDDVDGNPICVIVNYACHPVVLGGDNYLLSADYPGYATGLVKQVYGGDVVAMFLNGTTGNLNPLDRGSFEAAERAGTILGAEAVKVSKRIDTSPNAELRMAKEKVELKSGELPSESELESIIEGRKSELGDSYDPGREIHLSWAEDALDMVKQGKKSANVPVEVQVLRLGDIVLAGIPGEVFVEIGLGIKEGSPFEHTYAVSHTNGNIGYMPTKVAFQEGGYETHSAYRLYGIYPVDQDVAEKMINSSLKLIDNVK